jgi:N-methylhydantoinase B
VLLLATAGVEDTYHIARGPRLRLYDLHYRKPQPLVPRRDVVGIGEQRLQEIVRRFGLPTLEAARDEIFRQTEQIERAVLAGIPDGVYEAEGVLDNDGVDLETPVPIKLRITVSGEDIDFDVTQSADQTVGPVNCGVAQAVSALRVGYKLLVSPDLPGNGGSFRTMTTQVREGSVLGARSPAACQWYFSHLGLLIDMVARAGAGPA